MNKKLLALFAMMLAAASAVAKGKHLSVSMQLLHSSLCISLTEVFCILFQTSDEDLASTSLDEEALGSAESSSNSEDMDAAAAETMLNVGDLEYEDEDSSSDEVGGVRRYLRANGMDRELQKMTKVIGYKCKPSCMKKFSKCRTRCKVVGNGNSNTRCIGGHLPGKCKNNCCSGGGSSNGSSRINGIPGTSPYFPTAPLPYCPNGSWHVTGMSACIASLVPMPPGFPVCPSGTIGSNGAGTLCVVW